MTTNPQPEPYARYTHEPPAADASADVDAWFQSDGTSPESRAVLARLLGNAVKPPARGPVSRSLVNVRWAAHSAYAATARALGHLRAAK